MNRYLILLIILFIPFVYSCSQSAVDDGIVVKEFRLILDQSDLSNIYENYKEDIYIPVKVVYKGDTVKAKMRLRGDSSRGYDKKSMKIVFKKKEILQGEKRKINLNSEWTDETYIRQYVSSELMNKAGINSYKSNFIAVYVNNEFYGLFLQVENIDDTFLTDRGLDKKGNLYKATRDGACMSMFEYDNPSIKWEKKTNKKDTSFADLQKLIYDVNITKNADYKTFLQNTFEYDKLLKLVALNMLIKNGSTYYHNYYLYHNVNANGKWQIMPWDMDKSLNYYNWGPYDFQRTSSNWESDNPLIEKMLINDEVFADIKNTVEELSKTVFNKETVYSIIDKAEKSLEAYVAIDSNDKIESVQKWKKNLNTEKDYVAKRKDELLYQLKIYPRGFKLKENNVFAVGSKVTLEWGVSRSPRGKKIKYILKYGPHFLLEDTNTTRVINNIDGTSFTLSENLNEGNYYWRVYATDGSVTIEGFNTKSLFTVAQPIDIPKAQNGVIELYDLSVPYLIKDDYTVNSNQTFVVKPGVTVYLARNANFNIKGKLVVGDLLGNRVKFYSIDKMSTINFDSTTDTAEILNANFYNIRLKVNDSKIKIKKLTSIITEANTNSNELFYGVNSYFDIKNIAIENRSKDSTINNIFTLFKSKVNIEKSYFKGFNNGIELNSCSNSIVYGNRFVVINNNGITVNSCSDIKFESNSFQYLKTAVLVNKTDIKSNNINILGNKFETITTGILVKDKVNGFNYLGNNVTKNDTKEIRFDFASELKPSTTFREISNTIKNKLVLNKTDKPYLIKDTVVISKTGKLIIEKGVSVMFSRTAVLLVNGELIVNGTDKQNVNMFPQDEFSNKILVDSRKNSNIAFANIKDIQIIVTCPVFNMSNSVISIYNRPSSREKNNFVVFNGFKGEYNLLNNFFINNSEYVYENMNIFSSTVNISGNTIFGFEDSIEPINCTGKVSENIVLYALNDAVDVNGCIDIDIENNIFYKIIDKGVSVGAEQFGKSENVRIKNNLFYACDFGVEVKNNSTANIDNNTFVLNKTAIKSNLKKTGHENEVGGNAVLTNCVFYNSIDADFSVDEFSKISVVNSISNKQNTIKGVKKKSLKFVNEKLFSYSLDQDFVKTNLTNIIGYDDKK